MLENIVILPTAKGDVSRPDGKEELLLPGWQFNQLFWPEKRPEKLPEKLPEKWPQKWPKMAFERVICINFQNQTIRAGFREMVHPLLNSVPKTGP